MNIDILFGKTHEHVVPIEGTNCSIHKQALNDFLNLKRKALAEGLKLEIISGFRDYERQLKIWNLKAKGERPLYDDLGNVLEYSQLSPTEIMFAILRWSALPGTSRHHWGTDIDVFDAGTQTSKEVQLIPSECVDNGPAAKLHLWLDDMIETKNSFGFYRPYRRDLGGIAPERWHLSYAPLSRQMMDVFTFSLFKKNIHESDLLLKDELLQNAHEIYERFFLNVDLP